MSNHFSRALFLYSDFMFCLAYGIMPLPHGTDKIRIYAANGILFGLLLKHKKEDLEII